MVTRIDEKGKVFTDRVRKDSVRATIYTLTCVVNGLVHIRPDQRLRDDLNNTTDHFIAVTDAEVYAFDGETKLQSAPFIVLNKEHIVAVIPFEA